MYVNYRPVFSVGKDAIHDAFSRLTNSTKTLNPENVQISREILFSKLLTKGIPFLIVTCIKLCIVYDTTTHVSYNGIWGVYVCFCFR